MPGAPGKPRPPTRPKRLLPPATEQQLRALLAGGATRDEAAAAVGLTRRFLDTRLQDQLADLRVGRGRQGRRRRRPRGMDAGPEPTPAEIDWRAYHVRQAWSVERWLGRPIDDAAAPPELVTRALPR